MNTHNTAMRLRSLLIECEQVLTSGKSAPESLLRAIKTGTAVDETKTDPKNLTIIGSERAEERRLFETALKMGLATERYAGDHVRWMMPLFPDEQTRHHAYLLEATACVLMTRELPYMVRAYRSMNLHAGWLEARDWDVGNQARDAMTTARCRIDRMIANL